MSKQMNGRFWNLIVSCQSRLSSNSKSTRRLIIEKCVIFEPNIGHIKKQHSYKDTTDLHTNRPVLHEMIAKHPYIKQTWININKGLCTSHLSCV